MQRWLILGAVLAALGALLYLHLDSEEPSPRTAAGEEGHASGSGARQWFPWTQAAAPSSKEASPDGLREPQGAGAAEDDLPDPPGTFSLRGVVTDSAGQPLEGVHVRAEPSSNSAAETEAESETDAEGRFRLRALVPGPYDLSFARARFLPRTDASWPMPADPPPLTVALQAAPTVQGRVVDASGTPLSGVQVELYAVEHQRVVPMDISDGEVHEEPQEAEEQTIRTLQDSMETQQDGTFILDSPSPGTWRVRAQSQGLHPVEREVTSPAKDVWLVMGVGATLEVSVVDEQDRPVPRATVGLWRDNETAFTVELTTGETGHGVLQGVEPGKYGLVATPPPTEGFRMGAASLTLQGEKTRQVRLRLEAGTGLSGIVTTPGGKPVAGVELVASAIAHAWTDEHAAQRQIAALLPGVSSDPRAAWASFVLRMGEDRLTAPHRARTGPDGRFTVPHLLPFFYRVNFSKEGYVLNGLAGQPEDEPVFEWVEVPAGPGEVHAVMSYTGRVFGRVVRAVDGEPCTHFELNGDPFDSPDGTFTLTSKGAGPRTLKVLVPGVGGLRRSYDEPEGEDVQLGDLVVGEGRPVRVKVVDAATSLPLANVVLRFREQAPEPDDPRGRTLRWLELGLESKAQTGQDGTLLIPDVPLRPLVLTPERQGYESASRVLGAGEQETTLRLRPWATVQGQVRVQGAPLAAGTVLLIGRDQNSERVVVKNGGYSGHLVPPGRYTARVQCEECSEEGPVFVPRLIDVPEPQGLLTVDFDSAQGATLEVHASAPLEWVLLLPGQIPLPSNLDQINELAPAGLSREFLEGAGQGVRYRDVPPGRYTFFYTYETRRAEAGIQRTEWEVPASGELRIQLPSGAAPPPQEGTASGTEQ